METLVIAQARDGSTTFRDIVNGFFQLNCDVPNWGYVSDTFELWPAICNQIRDGYSQPLYQILESWEQRIEVSHGLGFVMPAVRAVFGRNLRILRVVRDREDHIRSLAKRIHIDPEHWLGYADKSKEDFPSDLPTVPRPTAVDFGEESESEWRARTVEQRFGWFIDKQSALIDKYLSLFDAVMTVHTEQLSDLTVIRSVGKFIDPNWRLIPQPVHIHRTSNVEIGRYSKEIHKRIEGYWEQFDLDRVIEDPSYAARFLLDDLIERYDAHPEDLESVLMEIRTRLDSVLASNGKQPEIDK